LQKLTHGKPNATGNLLYDLPQSVSLGVMTRQPRQVLWFFPTAVTLISV